MTLPRLLGFRTSRDALMILNTVGLIVLEMAVRGGVLPEAARVVNLTSLYGYAFLVAARDEETDLGFLCDVVVDGEFCVAALLLFLAAWHAAGDSPADSRARRACHRRAGRRPR